VERAPDGRWTVWVLSEDRLEQAAAEFQKFVAAPSDPAYLVAPDEARRRPAQEDRDGRAQPAPVVNLRLRWGMGRRGVGPLTLGLIAVCVAVGVASSLGEDQKVLNALEITQTTLTGDEISWQEGLPEVMRGEVWRLLTPMFIHFGIIHLVFNLFWLSDLGSMIEIRRGTRVLAMLVPALAVASNLAQYVASGPLFGGMSGVVYGLFGYIWIRGRFDPGSGLVAVRPTVVIMLVWLVLCMTGFVGPVANTAHVVGLVLGMAWGYVSSDHWRRLVARAGA
jgi:GlpG protein